MKRSLPQIASAIGARLIGDTGVEAEGVASIASAPERDLVFVEDEKYLAPALESRAAAVIAGEFAANSGVKKPLLISGHPKLAFALAAQELGLGAAWVSGTGVHPAAVVHPSARVAAGIVV